MKIETLKDLEAVFKLCRKQYVSNIEINGIKVHFGDVPELKTEQPNKEEIKETLLTDEELLFWSSSAGE